MTGSNHNISATPFFVNPTIQDYRLQAISSSIDAGDNFASGPFYGIDLEGKPRFLDANGDGSVVIDMGAYEFGEQLPLADAGNDQTLVCDHKCQAAVTLDARGSSHPGGGTLTFSWTGPFGTATGPTPTVTLPKGTHEITLTINDGNGGVASDTVVVTVIDKIAPLFVNLTVTPSSLLKANHQMVPVTVSVTVTDNCDSSVSCKIISVNSNEPIKGLGDGDKSPDWVITGNLTLDLRAERSAKGTGRWYTITVECTDSSGNRSTREVQVSVPR